MLPIFHFSIERWRKNTEYGVWVSNQGRIRLIKNKNYLEPRVTDRGYCYVFTEKGAMAIHRLVAYTWMGGKRADKYTIDHINTNKRDNSVKNLRWVEEEVNLAYAKFTAAPSEIIEKEPVVIESDECKFAAIFNPNLDELTRGRAALEMFQKGKLEIRADSFTIKDMEDLEEKKKKIATSMITDKFIGRIIKVANQHKLYCNHFWYVKEIKNELDGSSPAASSAS